MLRIRVGNTYERLSDGDSSRSRCGRHLKNHKWSLYCRVVEGDSFLIKAVHFHLHESFRPSTFSKYVEPFQTVQTSYGHFTANVEIEFFRQQSEMISWTLCFDDGGDYVEQMIRGGAYPTLADVPVPQNLTFGIELEVLLQPHGDIHSSEELADYLQDGGLNVRACSSREKRVTPYWKLVPDGSLKCSRDNPNCTTLELVSPILCGSDGLGEISAMLGILNDCEVDVNSSTGFHVHVGSDAFTFSQLRRIVANFVKYEDTLDLIMPKSRRACNNQYSKSNKYALGEISNKQANREVLCCRNIPELQGLWNSRYFKLNLERLSQESPTLEFRMHSGTTDYRKVAAWILFLLHFCSGSSDQADPDNFAELQNTNYKFNRMFQWIIKNQLLKHHFVKRRAQLGAPADNWECECGKRFPFPIRLYQHQKATHHSHPSCCGDCAH